MFHILETKQASGEILLFEIWKEDSAGLNDEITEGAKLTATSDGNIKLKEYSEYKQTFRGSSVDENDYVISVSDLIEAIKKAGTKIK